MVEEEKDQRGVLAAWRASRRPTHPRARQQKFEVLVGILGFFTFAALVQTVVAEVRGRSAITEVLILLCFLIGFALALAALRSQRHRS